MDAVSERLSNWVHVRKGNDGTGPRGEPEAEPVMAIDMIMTEEAAAAEEKEAAASATHVGAATAAVSGPRAYGVELGLCRGDAMPHGRLLYPTWRRVGSGHTRTHNVVSLKAACDANSGCQVSN